MHSRTAHGTGFTARDQVVHRGSAADAGGACRAVAALRLDGPLRGPQDPPGGGHGAHVATHPVGDCRACDGDVAAGGVIGVLGHHCGDRQQRGRGDRHPRLDTHLAKGRRVRPARQPFKPAGTAGPHRRRRRTRTSALHPSTATLVGVRAHHVRAAGGSALQGTAQRRGQRGTGAMKSGV